MLSPTRRAQSPTAPPPNSTAGGTQRRGLSHLEEQFAVQLRAAGLPEPVREYRFAPPRRFRFDAAWPDLRVAVEIDGGVWSGGRHTRGSGFLRDCEKLNLAALAGWVVLRFSGDLVRSGEAVRMVTIALNQRAAINVNVREAA